MRKEAEDVEVPLGLGSSSECPAECSLVSQYHKLFLLPGGNVNQLQVITAVTCYDPFQWFCHPSQGFSTTVHQYVESNIWMKAQRELCSSPELPV